MFHLSEKVITNKICENVEGVHGGKLWKFMDSSNLEYEDIVALDINDAFYPPAPNVVETAKKWLKALGNTPDTSCYMLRTKLSTCFHIDKERIKVGAGSSALIQSIITNFVKRGDRVIILDPTYAEYERCIRFVDGIPIKVELNDNNYFKPDVNEILRNINSNTKMAVICNPNNPTGQTIKKEDLLTILKKLNTNAFLVVDEAYIEFSPQNTLLQETEKWPNLIVLKSFSKAFSLAGLRIGYAVMGDMALDIYNAILSYPWPIGTLSLKSAEAALDNLEYVDEMVSKTLDLKDDLIRRLDNILSLEVIPNNTNFFLINIEATKMTSTELCSEFEKQRILVRDCSSFGKLLQERFIRIATQSKDKNYKIINAFKKILD